VNVGHETKSEPQAAAKHSIGLPLPGTIIWVTCIHIAIGLVALSAYVLSGNETWIRVYFDYEGALFFLVFGALEFVLAALAWRQFYADEPLHKAWTFIMLASAVRWVGLVVGNWLNAPTYINPLFYFVRPWDPQAAGSLRELGLLVGRFNMLLLAVGLGIILRLYKQLGILARLKLIDYSMLALVVGFVLRQGLQIYHFVSHQTGPLTFRAAHLWLTDPALACLLVEAILLRRAVVSMGWGLISKVWGSYTLAIFLTSLAHIGVWAHGYRYIPWQIGAIAWYLWFVVTAAYALGPAYQLQASSRAREQLRT
jgi:hypothetical protein